MQVLPDLSLAEWLVLALVCERPTHGFAIAALTVPDGELGRIWQLPRPVIYRALGRLTEAGLITAHAVESDRGPQRTLYAATAKGRRAVRGWLSVPVGHVRDVRSHLLVKLALLHRRGTDPTTLIRAQRQVLEPIVEALERSQGMVAGFDATLLSWRRATARAVLAFLDEIAASSAPRRPDRRTG